MKVSLKYTNLLNYVVCFLFGSIDHHPLSWYEKQLPTVVKACLERSERDEAI